MSVSLFEKVQNHANLGQLEELLFHSHQLIQENSNSSEMCIKLGALFQGVGVISLAELCYKQALIIAPNDLNAKVNLANIAHESGRHEISQNHYANLLKHFPNNEIIRRNALVSLEYNALATPTERLTMAMEWGGVGQSDVPAVKKHAPL